MSEIKNKQTIDDQEIENFSRIADEWWDPNGNFKPLHQLNPTRISYIKEQVCKHLEKDVTSITALTDVSILDVGCGGGLVCEPLTRLGANMTGLDASEKNIQIAKAHAEKSKLAIDYKHGSVEDLSQEQQKYDVVLALEIIEHVADVELFIQSCLDCLKPGGLIIFSTLNRTVKSYALGIVAAEYILRWLPQGTHNWKKFIKPSELVHHLQPLNANAIDTCGLVYNPLTQEFSLKNNDLDVNYFLTAVKQ